MSGVFVLLMALAISTAAYAQTSSQGALSPGRPAGVQKAMSESGEGTLLVGILALGVGVCAIAVAEAKGKSAATTTTSTSP